MIASCPSISRLILVGFLSSSLAFSTPVQAAAPRCEDLFVEQTQSKAFNPELFDQALREFRSASSTSEIEIGSPEKMMAFLEHYSSYKGQSTLGLEAFIKEASWLQMKKLAWYTRRLRGQNILTEKHLDKMVASVYRLIHLQGAPWGSIKNPRAAITRLSNLPDQLVKDRFDQLLAQNGLATALMQMFRFQPGAVVRSGNLTKFMVFTLMTAVGVTGTAGLHPIKGLDPYMFDIDILKDKMTIVKAVGLAHDLGYEQALQKFQTELVPMARSQRSFEVFKHLYNLSGKILISAYFSIHALAMVADHYVTIENSRTEIAEVNRVVPMADFIKRNSDIKDSDMLAQALWDQYLQIRRAQSPGLDTSSREILSQHDRVFEEVERLLQDE